MKNIPYLLIGFLILVIFFKDCSGERDYSAIESDTVKVSVIDTVFVEVSGSESIKPTVITETDTINHYITVTEDCDKPHLNDSGIELIKFRTYKDTIQIQGVNVFYNAGVLGRLQSIELGFNGYIPQINTTTTRTITNTVERNNSIGAYLNYNRSLQLGVRYQNKKLSYGLNYDLEYKTIGAQVGYYPFNW